MQNTGKVSIGVLDVVIATDLFIDAGHAHSQDATTLLIWAGVVLVILAVMWFSSIK